MSGTAGLEGRYQRLLALYPAEHRRAHQEEMLGGPDDGPVPSPS
jgi:hypothetical protein